MATDNTTIQSKLQAATARHATQLAAPLHAERTAAVAAATAAVNDAFDAEAAALQRALTALHAARTAQLESAAAAAEAARRARATPLLADAYSTAPGALASLVASFQTQPNRADAIKIRAVWDSLNQRAVAELGAELSLEVLGAIFVDNVIAQAGMAGGINRLGLEFQLAGISDGGVRGALWAFEKAQTPASIEAALIVIEDEVLRAARVGAGTEPDPSKVAHHALRRSCATRGDLIDARAELGRKHGGAVQATAVTAATEAAASPPGVLDRVLSGIVDRGSAAIAAATRPLDS